MIYFLLYAMASENYNRLYNHFLNYTALSESDFIKCIPFFREVQFPKNEIIIKAGRISTEQFFVISGCLRTYMYNISSNREHTLQFAAENWWASDYTSYYTGTPAIMNVECIEESTLFAISRSDENLLYKEVPVLEHYLRIKLENAFVAFQRRILAVLNQTAEERYKQFLTQFPDIEQRVRNYQIASYLGITPESLSRIRKQRMLK